MESVALVSEPLVSGAWHRVAGLRPSLVPGMRIVRQQVREQLWHVLVEPASGRQIRLNPTAYGLAARFDGQLPLEVLWQRQLAQRGDDAATQDEVMQLLGQLFRAGMIRFDAAPHLSLLFARRAEEGDQRRRGMLNPLSLRMPLANPTRWLQALAPVGNALFSTGSFLAWCVLLLLALLAAMAHAGELQADAGRLFATPSAYLLAWFCYPVIKLLHEFGHGLAVRRYGGEVHELGLSLMFLTPAPYVDASAANAFPSPRHRFLVSAAGVLVEMALGAVAICVWVAVGPGVVRDVALTVALICLVSTVLFNANPLMRLDGYYALCDALQLPNLALRSQAWWVRRWRQWVGAPTQGPPAVLADGEAKWLAVYAPLSWIYRALLLLGIVLWVGQQSWLLGWAAAAAFVTWAARTLWTWSSGGRGANPGLRRRSLRASAAVGAGLLVLLFVVPAPQQVVARAIVWPPDNAQLRAGAAGFVERLDAVDHARVAAGQTLAILQDPVLVATRDRVAAERTGLLAQQYSALLLQPARAAELAEDLERNAAELARVEEQLGQLEIRALVPGQLVWARPEDLPGSFAKRGAMLGHVLGEGPAHVRIALPEEEFVRTRGRVRAVEIRLAESPRDLHIGRLATTMAGATFELPSPALGDRSGGPIPVDPSDSNGVKARVPVFLLDAIVPGLRSTAIGGRAWVKLVLPARPLGLQWVDQLQQLLIKQFNPTGQT